MDRDREVVVGFAGGLLGLQLGERESGVGHGQEPFDLFGGVLAVAGGS
ncbi:MAG: hypothetical protein ACLP0J_25305 [Solirubrobacteraceae bacterium]